MREKHQTYTNGKCFATFGCKFWKFAKRKRRQRVTNSISNSFVSDQRKSWITTRSFNLILLFDDPVSTIIISQMLLPKINFQTSIISRTARQNESKTKHRQIRIIFIQQRKNKIFSSFFQIVFSHRIRFARRRGKKKERKREKQRTCIDVKKAKKGWHDSNYKLVFSSCLAVSILDGFYFY